MSLAGPTETNLGGHFPSTAFENGGRPQKGRATAQVFPGTARPLPRVLITADLSVPAEAQAPTAIIQKTFCLCAQKPQLETTT